MSETKSNKELEKQIFDELYNKRNVDIIDEMMAPEWVDRHMEKLMPGGNSSREGLKQFTLATHRAFPDMEVTIEDMIAEDDKVVVFFSTKGTHTGEPFMGMEATGQTMMSSIMVIDRWADGKIVESWGVMQQLPTASPGA